LTNEDSQLRVIWEKCTCSCHTTKTFYGLQPYWLNCAVTYYRPIHKNNDVLYWSEMMIL